VSPESIVASGSAAGSAASAAGSVAAASAAGTVVVSWASSVTGSHVNKAPASAINNVKKHILCMIFILGVGF
jgi:hypothetical protein